jgi:hypothetical protein
LDEFRKICYWSKQKTFQKQITIGTNHKGNEREWEV